MSRYERAFALLRRWLEGATAWSWPQRIVLAVAGTGLGVAAEVATQRALGTHSALHIAGAAAVLLGVYLGWSPGLVALGLVTVFTLRPQDTPGSVWEWVPRLPPETVVNGAIFTAMGLGAIAVARRWLHTTRAAEAAALRAELHASREAEAASELRAEIVRREAAEAALAGQNERLVRFAHMMAHDLKEPIRGVATLVRFIDEDAGQQLAEEPRRHLQLLSRIPARLTAMIDALLQFSESPAGDPPARPQTPTDMVGAARDMLAVMGPWLDERRAQVVIADDLPPAPCPPGIATRLLENLVANAVKYNRSPVPRVWVEKGTGGDAEEPGQGACYQVRDNGIGIPVQHRERVFGMFQRLHGRDEFGGGTGAGLALTRQIIERMGGRIWIKDPPAGAAAPGEGPGTVVCFTLEPRHTEAQRPARTSEGCGAGTGREPASMVHPHGRARRAPAERHAGAAS